MPHGTSSKSRISDAELIGIALVTVAAVMIAGLRIGDEPGRLVMWACLCGCAQLAWGAYYRWR